MENLKRQFHSFIGWLKTEKKYYEEVEEEDDDAVPSRVDFGAKKSKMVGLSDQYDELKERLVDHSKLTLEVVSLIGMPGIGKTILAKKIFKDPDIVEHFNCRVWITIGKNYQSKQIPRLILAQLNPGYGDKDTARYLRESLEGKRCLIVLDDVWDKKVAHHLQTSIAYNESGSGSKILLTSRLQQKFNDVLMRLLNKEESWVLLRGKVFAEGSCPSQLEQVGKRIANKCDGLPLTIIMVADLLSKADKTQEYWSEVARQKNHQLFMDAYDEISKVLLPSYQNLSRILQFFFLYMGVFPQNYEIPRSKLVTMWNADEFLEIKRKSSSSDPIECLEELVSNSLVMIYQHATGGKEIKACGLHSSLWHLSKRESGKIMFSHVLNSPSDGLGEAIKGQSRLSFHNNTLFGIKDVHKSVENNCASTARSLLCYGPYHPYQVPICFRLKSLKVLDALTIHFYNFPMEVLQLSELRYLALTLNGELHASISKLSHLQFLIVGRHLSINSCKTQSHMPVEIWKMKEMQHLQVMGSDLPDPPCGASLKSLLTLSNVGAHSCTEGVLKAIPNIRKLGIRIELAPDGDGKPLNCFDYISNLERLESLKCVVVNPEVVPPLAPLSNFMSRLTKLSLSGLGYPWKEMSKIAFLPCLQVLKLRNYAFRGPKWEVEGRRFFILGSLVIEDTDLVEWKIGHESFRWLSYLSIKHCYKLEKIEGKFEKWLEKTELVDCNPLGVEQMKKAVSSGWTQVDVHSSRDD